jgi:hypothetical protein
MPSRWQGERFAHVESIQVFIECEEYRRRSPSSGRTCHFCFVSVGAVFEEIRGFLRRRPYVPRFTPSDENAANQRARRPSYGVRGWVSPGYAGRDRRRGLGHALAHSQSHLMKTISTAACWHSSSKCSEQAFYHSGPF